jgi:hypothetical protein
MHCGDVDGCSDDASPRASDALRHRVEDIAVEHLRAGLPIQDSYNWPRPAAKTTAGLVLSTMPIFGTNCIESLLETNLLRQVESAPVRKRYFDEVAISTPSVSEVDT